MKRFFSYSILSFFLLLLPTGQASANNNDSIRLSLLTCAPERKYIPYSDILPSVTKILHKGLTLYSTTDCSVSTLPTSFSASRSEKQTTNWEQRIMNVLQLNTHFSDAAYGSKRSNLTDEEKTELIRLLQENYRPENRVYRYNFFYDNCATRPRDKIEESIAGKVIYPAEPQDGSLTFRDIVHQYCKGHPWARFGIDLCIGSEADQPITQRQMMFAPFYLMDAFDGAQIKGDSIQRPLITANELIVDATPEPDESDWMPTPLQCSLLLFILTAAATIYGIRRRTGLWGIDLFLFGIAGIVGCVLAFLALFSQHPAVSSNFLLLVFHPGQLLFLPYIIYCVRKGRNVGI